MQASNQVSSRIAELAKLERALDRPFWGMTKADFAEAGINPPTQQEAIAAHQHNIELVQSARARDAAQARKVLALRRPDLLEQIDRLAA